MRFVNSLRALILVGFFVPVTCAWAAPRNNNSETDSQLWSETRLVYKLDDKFDVFTAGSYLLTKNFTDFSRTSARFGGTWQATSALSVTPSYLYTVKNPWTTDPGPENRACLLLTYAIPIKPTATLVTLANTTEYRMPQGGQDAFWLRPKIRIEHPVGPDKWGLTAFVGNELFYNNGKEVFTQDRTFAGFQEKFNDTFTTSLYYCRRTKMHANIPDANAICIDFKITFGKKSATPVEPNFR
jgi:hypothetical protein